VGRGVGALIVAAACSTQPAPAGRDAGPRVVVAVAAPAPVPAPPDARPEADAEPIRPADVLSGPAAERAIAESGPGPTPAPAAPDAAELVITPLGVGPYALGMPRRELLRRLGRGARPIRERTPPGEPGLEHVDLFAGKAPLLRFTVYAGRLAEIAVLAHDRRAATDAAVTVGSSFDDAELAHGDPRRAVRGWILSALPGVIFAPADPSLLGAEAPPPGARIGAIIVVGPEAD
jgi:hypothetical protein